MKIDLGEKKLELPHKFGLQERKILVDEVLLTYPEYFFESCKNRVGRDYEIKERLDKLSYYLCTSEKTSNDKEIMRTKKEWSRKAFQEIPLSYAFTENWDTYIGCEFDYQQPDNRGKRRLVLEKLSN